MEVNKVTLFLGIILVLLLSINTIQTFTTSELEYCKKNCMAPKNIDNKKASCHKLTIDGKIQHLCHSYCKPGVDCEDDKCVSSCPFTRL
jgi:hypothetical protein